MSAFPRCAQHIAHHGFQEGQDERTCVAMLAPIRFALGGADRKARSDEPGSAPFQLRLAQRRSYAGRGCKRWRAASRRMRWP
jgi:hypothetical protein